MNALQIFGIWNILLALLTRNSHAFEEQAVLFSSCCALGHSSICRSVCKKIPPGKVTLRNVEVLLETCQASEVPFWKCINVTMQRMIGSSSLQPCCSNVKGIVCQLACYFSQSPPLIERVCSRKSKSKLKRCLGRMQVSALCCIDTKNIACYYNCLKIFSSDDGPNFKDVERMNIHCSETPSIVQCVKNFTNDSYQAVDLGKCCEHSQGVQCKKTCNEITSQQAEAKKRFSKLIKDCGFPLPQNQLWGCLLKSSAEQSEQRRNQNLKGLVLIKGHCCRQASGKRCKEWCYKVFQNPSIVTHVDSLYIDCMNDPIERKLAVCVGDVLSPCKYGCDAKVDFCSSFKTRPMQLYRRCNQQGDEIAKALFTSWITGHVVYRSLKFSIKDVRTCMTDMWKAVACSLALEPCSRGSGHLPICWDHCVELLSSCLRHDTSGHQQNPEEICSILVPKSKSKECLSLKEENKSVWSKEAADTPCHPSPCREYEVCVIQSGCDRNAHNCTRHRCVAGCKLPKTSLQLLQGSYIKVSYRGRKSLCSQVCKCRGDLAKGKQSALDCVEVGCISERNCFTEEGIYGHGEHFYIKCNFCTCSDGHLLCTTRTCQQDALASGLPCNCERTFHPVCTASGNTFVNLCLARCAGVMDNQLMVGDCQRVSPCRNNTCPIGYRQVSEPFVAICCHLHPNLWGCDDDNVWHWSLKHRSASLEPEVVCQRYSCELAEKMSVIASSPIADIPTELGVGDQEGVFYDVCGMDAASYHHSNVARQAMVPVDYPGSCVKVSNNLQEAGDMKQSTRCQDAKCRRPMIKGCRPFHPPMTCCPTCGAVVRALVSVKDLKNHRLQIDRNAITVQDILMQIQQLLYIGYCEVRGYLSFERDLVIVIQPIDNGDTDNTKSEKFHACHLEAERITGLFELKSPIVRTNYHLSMIKAVRLQTEFHSSSIRVTFQYFWLVLVAILLVIR